MANSVKSGFLRVDQAGGDLGPLVTTSSGGTADALTDTQLRATPVPVTTSQTANSTPTLSNVASSASSVTLLAANALRKGATIVNDSTAILFVKFGSTASTTSFTVELPARSATASSYYEVPFSYSGVITGIWASATGSARVTEITA